MSERVMLTDKFILSPKRVPDKGRNRCADAEVPGLILMVQHTGHRSFMLNARYPGSPNPTNRALGEYGELSLKEARDKAREWLALLRSGTDPKLAAARHSAAARARQDATIAAVWQAYYDAEGSRLAKADEIKRAGEAFRQQWGIRPADEITPAEIAAYFRPFRKTAPAEGHNRFGHLRRMFKWAIGTGGFGITTSPCRDLSPRDMFGEKVSRDRILSDDELRRVWQAASGPADASTLAAARARKPDRAKPKAIGYPFGPLVRLLVLTGQRLNDIAELSWSEIDFDKAIITIPASRMKMRAAHIVPLAPDALALLRSLPRFAGDYVFSTTGGRKPVAIGSTVKAELDALSGVSGWTYHDLRRTVRTNFSALPGITDTVRELVIAHQQKGLSKVYDLFSYTDEKRQCLTLWEQRLLRILSPKPPADVTDIEVARAARVAG